MADHLTDEQYRKQKAAVWRATYIMGIVTIIEVAIAIIWTKVFFTSPDSDPRMILNLLFILMSLMKAFFIVAEFMHLKYETRALVISILAPSFFFIWFIIAFMLDGQAWSVLRAGGW